VSRVPWRALLLAFDPLLRVTATCTSGRQGHQSLPFEVSHPVSSAEFEHPSKAVCCSAYGTDAHVTLSPFVMQPDLLFRLERQLRFFRDLKRLVQELACRLNGSVPVRFFTG